MFYIKTLYVGKFNIILIGDLAALHGCTSYIGKLHYLEISYLGNNAYQKKSLFLAFP